MKKITFETSTLADQQNLILALANSGYKVWASASHAYGINRYFVYVELKKDSK